MRLTPIFCAITALAISPLVACDDDATPDDTGSLEITGTWTDNFGLTTVITDTRVGTATVVSHNNTANTLGLQSAADDAFFPSLFSKLVWTDVVTETGLREHWQCTVAFGLATQAEAEAAPNTSDPSDLTGAGCGGFSWTAFRPSLAISGSWVSNYGEAPTISPFVWGATTVSRFDDAARWAVIQNPDDDAFSPNTFSRVVWTAPVGGRFYTCTTAFGLDSVDAAVSDTTAADDTDPAVSGCGDFAWSQLKATLVVTGEYTDIDGDDVTVSPFVWGAFDVADYNNSTQRAAVIGPVVGAPGPPNGVAIAPSYDRLIWQTTAAGLEYCITGTDYQTTAEALGTDASGDGARQLPPSPFTDCTAGPWTLATK